MKKIVVVFLGLFCTIKAYSQNVGRVEMVGCFLEDCRGLSAAPNIEFGYVTLPENYAEPDGKQIRVAFAIVRSQVANPKPDPVIWFEGGWGLPSLNNIFRLARFFPFKDRDLLVFDYRGSGYSEPGLCADLGQKNWELIIKDLNFRQFNDSINALAYDCLRQLQEQGVDYRQYGTEIKTLDAVMLVKHLGYEEVNLLGVSNGTMGIQGFIRGAEHAGIKIRSVISDSNVPMAGYRHGNSVVYYNHVLENVLNDCADNPSCARAFPDLKNRFYTFLRELEGKPLISTGKDQLVFNRYEINGMIHQLLYNHKNHKDIPILLEALMAGRLSFFDPLYDFFRQFIGKLNGTSVINYVYDWKVQQEDAIALAAENKAAYPEFELLSDFYLDLFISDKTVGFNPRDTIHVISDVPALILAGSYDPVTPPLYSDEMNRRYTNSYYFILPKIGHGAVMTPCGEQLARDFLENPHRQPVGDCVEALHLEPIPFTTSYYANQQISSLMSGVAQQKSVALIILIVLPFLYSMVFFIREVIRGIQRKTVQRMPLVLSLGIVVFFTALAWYLFQTLSAGGLLLLFGLAGSASWLPWLALLILALALGLVIQQVVARQVSFWSIGMLVSSALTGWIVVAYQLLPF